MKAETADKLKNYLKDALKAKLFVNVQGILAGVDEIITEDGPLVPTVPTQPSATPIAPVQPSTAPTAPVQPSTAPAGQLPPWVRFVQLKTLDGLSLETIQANLSAAYKDASPEQVEKVFKLVRAGQPITASVL